MLDTDAALRLSAALTIASGVWLLALRTRGRHPRPARSARRGAAPTRAAASCPVDRRDGADVDRMPRTPARARRPRHPLRATRSRPGSASRPSSVRNAGNSSRSATSRNTSAASSNRSPLAARSDLAEHLGDQALDVVPRDRRAVLGGAVLMDPLPHLRARDLGGRGILHEVVDRHGAEPAQPRLEVADRHRHVRLDARGGHRPADVHVEQCGCRHLDVVALPVDLVRPVAEDRVELRHRDRDQVGVRHPRAVEAVAGLALLVGGDLLERPLR